MLTALREQFDLSMVAAGWLSSLSSAMSASAALVFGIIVSRTGAMRFACVGLVALAMGNLIGALAQNAWSLFCGRFIEGLGFMAMVVAIPALIASAAMPADRSKALGYWGLHVTLGSATGIGVGALLADANPAWRVEWIYFTVAALLVLLALMLFAWRVEARASVALIEAASVRRAVREALARRGPWLMSLVLIMQGMQFSTIIVWLPSYLRESMAVAGATAALATALFFVVAACGSVFGGSLLHGSVNRGAILLMTFPGAGLLFCAVMTEALPPVVRMLGIVVAGFIYGITATVAISGAAHYARSAAEVGILQGLLAQTVHIGMSAGPPLAAVVVSWSSDWSNVRWLVLAAVTFGMLGAAGIVRDDQRRAGTMNSPTPSKDVPLRANW